MNKDIAETFVPMHPPAKTAEPLPQSPNQKALSEMADALSEITSRLRDREWQADEEIVLEKDSLKHPPTLARNAEGVLVLSNFYSTGWGEDDEGFTVRHSVDQFLEETEEMYSYGDDGWGEVMIADLEDLKAAIQKRIDAMRDAISKE